MPGVINQPSLDLDAARAVAEAAVAKAAALGLRIHVHVVDAAGNPLVYLRMPGAPPPAREFSEKKAYTAAAFGRPTAAWRDKLAHKPLVAQGLAEHPRVALFGGGEPIRHKGVVVGAVGIAGALEEEDVVIAEAAVAAFG